MITEKRPDEYVQKISSYSLARAVKELEATCEWQEKILEKAREGMLEIRLIAYNARPEMKEIFNAADNFLSALDEGPEEI